MRYIYPLAVVLFIVTACSEKNKEKEFDRSTTDWAHYDLKGDVKTLTIRSNEVLNNSMEAGDVKFENTTGHNTEYKFSEDGMLILEKKQNSKGGPYEQTTYNGRQSKLEQIQYVKNNPGIKTSYTWDDTGKNNTSITRRNPDNSQIDRKVMKYKKGVLTEKITYNKQNNPIDKITYEYDNKGNLIQENLYLGSEYIQIRNTYTYNDGKKVSETRYNKDDEVIFSTRYAYNGDNLEYRESTNAEGIPDYTEEMKYDANDNLIVKEVNDSFDKVKTIERFQYNDDNKKIAWQVIRNDELYIKANYGYDEYGNLSEYSVTNSDETVSEKRKYVYEYDENNNWIQKTVLIDNEPKFIERREIAYY